MTTVALPRGDEKRKRSEDLTSSHFSAFKPFNAQVQKIDVKEAFKSNASR